jgi:hypothetical protein
MRSHAAHKFQIGQTVFLTPSNRHIPEGAYIVTKKLPERDGEFEYRVKSANEAHERVVREGAPVRWPRPVIRQVSPIEHGRIGSWPAPRKSTVQV